MKGTKPLNAHGQRPSGYTLIELVISMTVLSLIGLVSSNLISGSMSIYTRIVPAMEMSYQSDLALRTMKREIRDLSDADAIVTMSSATFAFIDSASNTVTYALTETNLTRNGDLLASDVNSLTFRYWEIDGTVAESPEDVRLIEVDLSMQSGDETWQVRTPIFPRYFGFL